VKRITVVATCGSANQDLFMVHALWCPTTLLLVVWELLNSVFPKQWVG